MVLTSTPRSAGASYFGVRITAARTTGHGRPRRARLFRGAAHVLGERPRVLPGDDGRDRRRLARRRPDGAGEPVGPRPHLRGRGGEPVRRLPSRGVPGARRRPPRRGCVSEQRGVPGLLQGVGRLGARLRRRLGVLGRACLGGAAARRCGGRGALGLPLRPLRRAVRRRATGRAHPGGARVPRGIGRRLPA